jgi:RNA polymerase sigma-70 factor (ECF subfamily)
MTLEELQDTLSKVAIHDDQFAFEKIYTFYYNKLYSLALSIVKSEEAAEEIYNDVLLNIWKNRASLPEINNFTVYLYVAIKNQSLRCLSRLNKINQVNIDEINIEIRDFSPTAHDQMISSEFLEVINEAIDTLSPQCKLVFKLVKEDELKYKDVAQILNMSIKNVEYHIANALKKISLHITSAKKPFIKGAFKSIISN